MTGMSGSASILKMRVISLRLALQVKGMLQRVWENAKGNGGKLSKLGALQHQASLIVCLSVIRRSLLRAMR